MVPDGARLATGVFMALTLLFCGMAGRELHGKGNGAIAGLLLMGCFGLVLRGHDARLVVTDAATRQQIVQALPQLAALTAAPVAAGRRVLRLGGALAPILPA